MAGGLVNGGELGPLPEDQGSQKRVSRVRAEDGRDRCGQLLRSLLAEPTYRPDPAFVGPGPSMQCDHQGNA
eukprot:CAMPEP_0117695506 /NCGR_PEP_ID=MMETSP0804-20121206/28174_1 /TAXON_ID=1074897 /ORGANISM="Tetraselmis astigmatica, Strain CCMP880" /LENGTH=70 /DNA_ID=CAMNT_0005509579 /DNA_START=1101 /DNA_END=1313 /DNA_ORIENTATION=+